MEIFKQDFSQTKVLSLVGKLIALANKYEFCLLATPAYALYQAMKASITPKTPPALVTPTLPENSPIQSNRNVKNRMKNKAKNITVDFRVHNVKPKVKIVQPNR